MDTQKYIDQLGTYGFASCSVVTLVNMVVIRGRHKDNSIFSCTVQVYETSQDTYMFNIDLPGSEFYIQSRLYYNIFDSKAFKSYCTEGLKLCEKVKKCSTM